MKKSSTYQFFGNAISLFSIKGIELGLTVLLIPYLIFKVGLTNYGMYAFALSMVLFFVNITNFGFDLTGVRDLAKFKNDNKKVNQLFNEVFTVKLYLTIFMLLLLFLLIALVPNFRFFKEVYIFSSILLVGELFSLRWFFMGLEKMKYIPAINLVATLIYVVLVLLLIQEPNDFTYIILLQGVGILIAGIISFIFIVVEYNIKIQLLPFEKVKRYLYTNFSSFINLFIPSMISNTAVFIVGIFSIPAHVSIMQLAVKYTNAFTTVNAVFTKVFYAMVNRKIQLMRKALTALIFLGIILSIGMFLSADILIKPWLKINDPEIEEQIILVIKLLSPSPFLMAVISAYGVNGLLVLRKDKLFGQITLFSTVVALLIGLFFIPTYSYLGGVVFFLGARVLYAVGSFLMFHKKRIFKRQHIFK